MIVKVIEKDGQWFLPLDRKQMERLGCDPESGIELHEEGARLVLEAAPPVADDEAVDEAADQMLEAHRETFRKLAQ